MNEDNKGSGSVVEEETKREDPPRMDCRFPSLSSLLKIERAEVPPLRNLLLCCTCNAVNDKYYANGSSGKTKTN